MLLEVSFKDLQSKLESLDSTMVLVYTSMCGTCENAKVMFNIVSEAAPHIKCLMINANLNKEIIALYDITSIPCFLFFKKQILIDQFYAFHSATFLFNKVTQ
jgi:thiol-disulfide isomerase/thioredoxin